MKEKTIEKLNTKIWYRLIKVLYILTFILILWLNNINAYFSNDYLDEYMIINICIIILFLLIRHSFYYIYLGKIFPKK